MTFYAWRIDPVTLYLRSYRLGSNGNVLEEIDNSEDVYTSQTTIDGKSGNFISVYAERNYLEGYLSRVGCDYVTFEVDNADSWQIGDVIEITYKKAFNTVIRLSAN